LAKKKQSSEEKRHKQNLKRRARNRHVRSTVKTVVKDARVAVAQSPGQAGQAVSRAMAVIAKAGSKGVLHKKTAARKTARLAKAAHKASAGR
jgi:small subunit ribosomal protein S20